MKYIAAAVTHMAGVAAFVALCYDERVVAGWVVYFSSYLMALLLVTHLGMDRGDE